MKKILVPFFTLLLFVSIILFVGNELKMSDDSSSIVKLTLNKRTTNGVIMLDENGSEYFVDYIFLENNGIANIEKVNSTTVVVNEYGEILSIQ